LYFSANWIFRVEKAERIWPNCALFNPTNAGTAGEVGAADGLKTANWNSEEWRNVRKKMKALCENCCPNP
jgi:hypothetical protein